MQNVDNGGLVDVLVERDIHIFHTKFETIIFFLFQISCDSSLLLLTVLNACKARLSLSMCSTRHIRNTCDTSKLSARRIKFFSTREQLQPKKKTRCAWVC